MVTNAVCSSHGDDIVFDGVVRETKSLVITKIEDFRTTSLAGPQPYAGEETRVPRRAAGSPRVRVGTANAPLGGNLMVGFHVRQGVEEVKPPSLLPMGTDRRTVFAVPESSRSVWTRYAEGDLKAISILELGHVEC